ncbi:MAG TPA: peptidoglycan-binding domain-containing protein [Gemmatimonadaceae bacterium]|jgi:peptidoglycan hydrolase-like protein with peptidoglycan-binding domain|nr:peptidoglycan-binding domain-containing protein [Gemmatimonadaceae bacterium]
MKKTIAVIALMAVPALASAQAGLSRVSFLALQQELRDQGCGVTNVDGHFGPQTRRAIATCAKKFNSANNAAALLQAMNIGFGPNDNPPTGGTGTGMTGDTGMSMSSGGGGSSVRSEAKAEGESVKTERKEVRTARRRKAAKAAAADTTKH